jgi:hypothetical protein
MSRWAFFYFDSIVWRLDNSLARRFTLSSSHSRPRTANLPWFDSRALNENAGAPTTFNSILQVLKKVAELIQVQIRSSKCRFNTDQGAPH